ncbi:MFS transporter [Paludibacterium purpuratum]|uniref:MFS transporter n=2 Tax=Paludibacterium purpuratum TaxID=1144873 RepID=A0A4R7BCU5_9NEIS|nr:MFS transporter [Paludibacterium purpuratum]
MNGNASTGHLGMAGLLVLLAGQLLPQVDFAIVNVALADLARSLHATETDLELMVAVYGVAFAVCLAMGGRLGDNFGRRRLFNWGVGLFGIASLLCGVAPSIGFLLAARALQGGAAALLVPQILATIHVCLRGLAHARALGFYGAVGGLAFVVGQVLGGLLVSANIAGLGWRSVFLINLPICLAILLLSGAVLPETRRERPAHIDLSGTLVLTMLILCLLLPLALGPSQHWSWPCLALLAACLPLLLWLGRVELAQERRGFVALMPPSLLRIGSVRFGLLMAVVFYACWSGFMFVMALTLQAGAGLSPLDCGNAFISLGVAYFVSSLYSTRLVARLGRIRTLLLACVVQMSGLVCVVLSLRWVWPHPGALSLTPALVLLGVGQAQIVSCFFRIGLSDVPADHAGAGSAMLSTVQQAAFGLGSAVLGAVFAQTLSTSGDYLAALQAGIGTEFGLMMLLLSSTLVYGQRLRRALAIGCAA